jgi:(1->4)-alpha-D-glucan 1-alpha-D-glucosylmutase
LSTQAPDRLSRWRTGEVKQQVVAATLALRQASPALFQGGLYEPLEVRGARADHIVAYRRHAGNEALLVVAPLRCAGIVMGKDKPVVPANWWEDTTIVLPGRHTPSAHDAFTGRTQTLQNEIGVADLLADFPVAVARLES